MSAAERVDDGRAGGYSRRLVRPIVRIGALWGAVRRRRTAGRSTARATVESGSQRGFMTRCDTGRATN